MPHAMDPTRALWLREGSKRLDALRCRRPSGRGLVGASAAALPATRAARSPQRLEFDIVPEPNGRRRSWPSTQAIFGRDSIDRAGHAGRAYGQRRL